LLAYTLTILSESFSTLSQMKRFGTMCLRVRKERRSRILKGKCWISSLRPFNVAFFILGGGSYVFCSLLFRPSTGAITCGIDLRITASASLSITLGPIRGGVYVYLGVTATFRSGGGSSSFGVLFIIRGDVSICGIISAYVALTLSASYDSTSKAITGEGRLDVEVKICWCFTFKIHQSLSYTDGG